MCVSFDYFLLSVPNGLYKMPYTFLYYDLKYFECIPKSYELNVCRSDLSLYLPVRHGDLNQCLDFTKGSATDMDHMDIPPVVTLNFVVNFLNNRNIDFCSTSYS